MPSPTCFHHTPCLAAPILFWVKLPRIGRVLITQSSSSVLITKGLLCRLLKEERILRFSKTGQHSQKLCYRVHLVSLVLEKEKIVIVNSSMPSGIICFARSPLPILSSHGAELYLVLSKIIHRVNRVACRCCNDRCLEHQTSCVHAIGKESRSCSVNQARMRAHVVLFESITSRKHFMCSPLWEKTATDESSNCARSPRFMPMISVLLGFEDTSTP